MPNDNVVIDDNNIPQAMLGIRQALDEGMEDVFEDTLSKMLSNWESGMDALGNDWASIADSTIEAKSSSDILIDSGDLRSDVRDTSHYDEDENAAIFSSELAYAGIHEFGALDQGIPPRPFLQPAARYAGRQQAEVLGEELDDKLDDARVR